MDNKDLYHKALTTYGAEAQTTMVFEEMAELQKELCKHRRGADNREAVAEEIADVQIMLEQMIELHDCGELVNKARAHKLWRLAGRLETKKEKLNESRLMLDGIEYRRHQCTYCCWTWLEDCDASDYPNYCPFCGAKMDKEEPK